LREVNGAASGTIGGEGLDIMSAIRKSKAINLRIDPEAHDLIACAAEICGKSITAFMTEASVHSAQEELLDQRFIGVSAEIFETVSQQLAAPGIAHERLVKLFQSRVQWMDRPLAS
jgi:uncharacterized protein (DUF1778 family)